MDIPSKALSKKWHHKIEGGDKYSFTYSTNTCPPPLCASTWVYISHVEPFMGTLEVRRWQEALISAALHVKCNLGKSYNYSPSSWLCLGCQEIKAVTSLGLKNHQGSCLFLSFPFYFILFIFCFRPWYCQDVQYKVERENVSL